MIQSKLGKNNSTQLKGSVELFMSKNLTKIQWIYIISLYKENGILKALEEYKRITNKTTNPRYIKNIINSKAKILDNKGMEALNRKKGSGRPIKRDDSDISSIIDELNEEEKREIIQDWIKYQRDKKDKNSLTNFEKIRNFLKPKILNFHRTSYYKNKIERKYKYDYLKNKVEKIFKLSNGIYGSRKISVLLRYEGINIIDRTLRHYMARWGFITLTRKCKRKSESKNTKVKFKDLVKRNYNPNSDNIIATDVSYIPANVDQRNVYLSAAINHKTKFIESWKVSMSNDDKLVIDTIHQLNRTKFILHSDHGSQYSSNDVLKTLKELKAKTSMARIGNSLDNREIEYFFGVI